MKKNLYLILATMLLLTVMLNGQVNTERFRVDKEGDAFNIKWGLSMALHKGNVDLFRVDSDLNINLFKGNNYLFLVGNIAYGEKNDSMYISKGFIHLRGVRRANKRFMVEAFVQQEFNEFILLKSRTLLGGGLRILLFKREGEKSGLAVNAGVGGMWENEKFKESGGAIKKENTSNLKSTNYLSINWAINKSVTLGNVSYLQLGFGDEETLRIYSDTSIDVKLSKVLSFHAKLNYRYDSNPPEGIKNEDIQLKNGLTLTI